MRNPGQPLPDHAAILATLSRSVPAPAAQVAPGTVVRVTGTAQPGRSGLLTAPFSGRPCVWFRTLEVRYDKFGAVGWNAGAVPAPVMAKVLASDMGYGDARAVDVESPVPFAVADGNGNTVLVDPVRADVSTPVVSVDSTEGEWRFADYVLRREWLLEAGAPVFAVGPVDATVREPILRATPADCTVVSAFGEAMLVERAHSSLAVSSRTGSGRGLVIGLSAAAAALLVVLVVLLVAR